MLRTAGPIANCIYAQAATRPRCRTRISPASQMLRAGLAFPLLTRKHVGTRTMRKRKALIFAATTILVSPVYAETCPDPIAEASRLVLVTTRSMDTQLATMQLFTRQSTNKPWKRISAAEPAVVGKAGLGWGYSVLDLKDREEPEKVEGDKRTPAGFFRIGASFGFAPSRRPATLSSRLVRRSVWRIPPRLFTTPSPSARRSVRWRPMTCAAVRSTAAASSSTIRAIARLDAARAS